MIVNILKRDGRETEFLSYKIEDAIKKIHFNVEQLSKIAYVLDIDIVEFFK